MSRFNSRLAQVLAVVLLAASAGDAVPFDLRGAELVDLTYPFDTETIYWPNAPSGFELERLAFGPTPGGWFYAANALCAPEHGGTHLDAPIHFAAGRRTVEQVPVQQLIAPAAVIDVSDRASVDADYRLTREDVLAWEADHGRIDAGTIVLLRTGWGRRWPDRKSYLGDDTPGETGDLHFPSYGAAAAALLVVDRRVGALGVDTASIDPGPSRDFPVHRIAADAEVPGLENVANLERLPATGAWIIALPMKIAGGSGGPVRIVAALPPPSEVAAEAIAGGAAERLLDWMRGRWRGVRRDAEVGSKEPMTVEVEAILGGAGLVERIEVRQDDGAYRGHATQVFDSSTGHWIRMYVNEPRRHFVELEGEVEGDRIVWRSPSADGTLENRVVSERLGRERWRRSASRSEDGGATWRELFVDELERESAPPSP